MSYTAFEYSDTTTVTATVPDGNKEKLFSKITISINRNRTFGKVIAPGIAFA